jgi:hypothetical protein
MGGTMRILICGDRWWGRERPNATPKEIGLAERQREVLYNYVSTLPPGTTIIEGAAPGADQLAGRFGRQLGFSVTEYPPDWAKYGRAAGPIRNKQMLVDGQPDRVAAFHDDIENSKGTKNMLGLALAAGTSTEIITSG